MFAGKMKLRNFVLLVVGLGGIAAVSVGTLVVVGAISLGSDTPDAPVTVAPARIDASPTPVAPIAPAVAAAPAAPAANVPPGGLARRDWDQVVFDNQSRDLHGDKLKDVSKGKSYKVNLYQDAGKGTMNRAKVDIDRDDKWDEKYTVDGGAVTLQIAPADDENYTKTYLWNGGAWEAQ